jgi:hypothetical protein
MILVRHLSGSVLCTLNIQKNAPYEQFHREIDLKIISPNVSNNALFVIVDGNTILYYSLHPTFFKQKLNLSDELTYTVTRLEEDKYMRLLDFSRELENSYYSRLYLEDHEITIAELSKNYRDDPEFMSIICANTTYPSLRLASKLLLDNKDFLFSICYKNGDIACFVIFQCSKRLQYDVEFIQKLIDFCTNSICNANKDMQNERLLLYAIEKGADSRVLDLLELL